MASKGGSVVPQETKKHIKSGRVTGARKPNGTILPASSHQHR